MKTEKTNEELVALIQSGMDVQENMGLLLEQNRGLVCLIAKKMPISNSVDLDDLIQEGCLGLIKAVDSYDESKGAFTTHAGFYIKATIVRNIGPLMYDKKFPAYMIDLISKYRRFCAECENENGEPPSDEKLLQGLGINKKALKDLRLTLKTIHSVSLDADVSDAEDLKFGDTIADPVNVSDIVVENIYGRVEKRG